MNKNLQTVFHYHETTKHAPQRYARSLGYMDWETQPNPFRNYNGAKTLEMPLSFENNTPPYHLLDSQLPSAPLVLESLSQLLQFSMGIAAHKQSGPSRWAVRCNASSGNLHPTETYLLLPPVLGNQTSSVVHYAPKNHELETLCEFDTQFWDTLPPQSFLLGFSSIAWREAWKYGERAFRYTQLDAGHAWQSMEVSAKMLGWKLTRLDSISDSDINTLFGIKQANRFFEDENADMLFIISPDTQDSSIKIDSVLEDLPLIYEGIANRLSATMHPWDIIAEVEDATSTMQIAQKSTAKLTHEREESYDSKYVVLKRRSIHMMHKEHSFIEKKSFHTILSSVNGSLDSKECSTHLCIFMNRVHGYDEGIYTLVRNNRDLENLKEQMHDAFLWQETELANLYLLEKRDFKVASKSISCNQDIASDGAFSLGMLCNFSEQLQTHGAHRYKELYWECGMIGQELYLEATSLKLSGTGIGCFLDDMMHKTLGIKNNSFQVLYHFTIGLGDVDSRIMTAPAYERM